MSGEFTPTINDANLLAQGYTPAAIEEFRRWVDELPPEVFAAARAEGAAAEREACAQVVLAAEWPTNAHNKRGLLDTIAAAIRARSGDGDPLTTHDAEVAARAIETLADEHMLHGGQAWKNAHMVAAEFRAGERST